MKIINKMNKIKNVNLTLSTGISFLISVFVVLIIILSVGRASLSVLFNKNIWNENLKVAGAIEYNKKMFSDSIINYSEASGIPSEKFNSVLESDIIDFGMKAWIDDAFDYITDKTSNFQPTFDTSNLKSEIVDKANDYANSMGIKISADVDAGIETFAAHIITSFKVYSQPFPGITNLLPYLKLLYKFNTQIFLVPIMLLISLLLLFLANFGNKRRFITWFLMAMVSGGLLSMIIGLFMFFTFGPTALVQTMFIRLFFSKVVSQFVLLGLFLFITSDLIMLMKYAVLGISNKDDQIRVN